MSEPVEAPRRFYQAVRIEAGHGYAILLDGRRARTPGGEPLNVPTEALAKMLAAEWEAQGEHIRMATMPATRLAFTAIDRVGKTREAVCAEVARYAGSDLLCYFADQPQALVLRQEEAWGPLLEWAAGTLGLRLARTVGVTPAQQPAETLLRVARLAGELDDFGLAGLAHATALLGSAVLALALHHRRVDGEAAFALSHLDEAFQNERWGVDEEAAARAAALKAETLMLDAWFRALGG
ncbi:MAG TPA: ATP12 family protein [Caulobacteraceae bacterium]|nr:ATP12 family protein [Caulobacteraceae bacterium]